MLYESTTGTAPFEAKTPLAVLRRVSDETQMPLMRLNPDVPKWLSDAVDRLLAKEPEGRYQTAAEVAVVFADGLAEMHLLSPLDVPAEVCTAGSRTSSPRNPICWKAVGNRVLPWVGGALAGALLVGSIWALSGSNTPEPKPEPQQLVAVDPGPAPRHTLGQQGDTGAVWVITFLDPNRVVVGMESDGLKVWDLKSGTVLKSLTHDDGPSPNIWSADVSPDGKYLMTASDDSAVTFWNLQSLQFEFAFPESVATKTAAFSPCGKFLATGNRNSKVKIWDWVHQMSLVELHHRGTVHSLSYSPDGKRLASAGSDGKVRVWDLSDINWEKRE